MTGKVLSRLDDPKPCRLEQRRHVCLLRVSYLDGHPSGRLEICLSLLCYRPVSIEPIRTAIQGSRGIEIPDLALQGLKLVCRYVGRVCDNCMVGARNFFKPVRTDGLKAPGKPVFPGIPARGGERIGGNVDANGRGLRHFRKQRQGDGAGARAEIEDAANPFPCGSLAQVRKQRRQPAFPCPGEAPAFRAKDKASAHRIRENPICGGPARQPRGGRWRLSIASFRFGRHRHVGASDRIGEVRAGEMLDDQAGVELRRHRCRLP